MNDQFSDKPHLLIDAAGPTTLVGILENGTWKTYREVDGPSMENLRQLVADVLNASGYSLKSLYGLLYAEGPGSTLGLRLAAMFARTLMTLPELRHWISFRYNNLQLTGASYQTEASVINRTLYAPWKKQCFHRVQIKDTLEEHFSLDTFQGTPPEKKPLFVQLGLKRNWIPTNAECIPYPTRTLPATLTALPSLLKPGDVLEPYNPSPPEFARWEAKAHSKP
jgi:hypothetical protein